LAGSWLQVPSHFLVHAPGYGWLFGAGPNTIEQSEENKEFNELCEFLNHLPEDMNMKWQLNASQEHYVGVINVI